MFHRVWEFAFLFNVSVEIGGRGGVTSHNWTVIGTSINCPVFWRVHGPCVLSLTAITALQLNCQLWLYQIFGQIIQTNHGQSLARQQPGSDRGLHWAGPHLTAAACLLSIIISWHRLYLLYLVSSIYPVSRPTLYLYNQIVRHQHLQERYGRSTALAWLLGRKVCRKNIEFKSTWFFLFSCRSFRIECSPE